VRHLIIFILSITHLSQAQESDLTLLLPNELKQAILNQVTREDREKSHGALLLVNRNWYENVNYYYKNLGCNLNPKDYAQYKKEKKFSWPSFFLKKESFELHYFLQRRGRLREYDLMCFGGRAISWTETKQDKKLHWCGKTLRFQVGTDVAFMGHNFIGSDGSSQTSTEPTSFNLNRLDNDLAIKLTILTPPGFPYAKEAFDNPTIEFSIKAPDIFTIAQQTHKLYFIDGNQGELGNIRLGTEEDILK
jgi:hypothetical protein